MLYHVPLESYSDRYTSQWSAPGSRGWLESKWMDYQIPFHRVDGLTNTTVSKGVIDFERRVEHAFIQTRKLINLINTGIITGNDTILFDDFWHPGVEQIRLAGCMKGVHPTMQAFCHAQSIDKYDFLHKWKHEVRATEIAYSGVYDTVFVNNNILAELFKAMDDYADVAVCGHVFDSQQVLRQAGGLSKDDFNQKQNRIVFSSRWAEEKQPGLFLEFADTVLSDPLLTSVNTEVWVLSGSSLVDIPWSRELRLLKNRYNNRFVVLDNLTKTEYYDALKYAKIQVSTSLQDWISFCLLESVTLGCYPLYPNFRSFPGAFGPLAASLYTPWSVEEMLSHAQTILYYELFSEEDYQKYYETIVRPHDLTWARMLLHNMTQESAAAQGISEEAYLRIRQMVTDSEMGSI